MFKISKFLPENQLQMEQSRLFLFPESLLLTLELSTILYAPFSASFLGIILNF